MDKNRVIGSLKHIQGSIEETAGKLVGDAKLQADGKAHKAEGQVQNLVGSVKDALKPTP
jgi:uncharacterized protein YjbJ (UPF0337 family)